MSIFNHTGRLIAYTTTLLNNLFPIICDKHSALNNTVAICDGYGIVCEPFVRNWSRQKLARPSLHRYCTSPYKSRVCVCVCSWHLHCPLFELFTRLRLREWYTISIQCGPAHPHQSATVNRNFRQSVNVLYAQTPCEQPSQRQSIDTLSAFWYGISSCNHAALSWLFGYTLYMTMCWRGSVSG